MKPIMELKNCTSGIVIFGAGKLGRYAYLFCKRVFPNAPVCFCDNNVDKQSEFICGCTIISPQKAAGLYREAAYIVANALFAGEMCDQLAELGICGKNIFLFGMEDYYSVLTLDELWEINKENYARITDKKLDKKMLRTFTEKMQYSKIYCADRLKTTLTDKYLVKNWVKEKIGEEYLIPLLGVYSNADEIDFDKLPDSFVLKANHGCGMNYIVPDKRKIDFSDLNHKLQEWLGHNFAYASFELQYRDIKPCIIAEQYIEDFSKESFDYKFFCFDGKVKVIMIVKNMNRKDSARCFYDTDFQVIPCDLNDGVHMPENPFEKPGRLQDMIDIAEKLSEGMDQVRVDLYAPKGKIYFGEMTFTSWSGNVNIEPKEADLLLGGYWSLGIA